MPTFGSLFAGVGGFDLGFEAAGWECRWQVEWDARCRSVLARHWPHVPRYGDVADVIGNANDSKAGPTTTRGGMRTGTSSRTRSATGHVGTASRLRSQSGSRPDCRRPQVD